MTEGGAIADMSQKKREEVERHVATCPNRLAHPITGEMMPRRLVHDAVRLKGFTVRVIRI
jgi:hypothetical protein